MAVGLFLILNYTNPIPLTLSLPSLSLWTHNHPKPVSFNPRTSPISPAAVRFLPIPGESRWRRGTSVVRRAGPSVNTYIIAFMLPFSLIVVTVFAALRLSDKLDEKYLEELRLSEALRDDDDDDDDDDDNGGIDIVLPIEEPAKAPIRNRPKREI